MASSKKVSELPSILTLTADDLIYVVNDPAGTPESFKTTVKVLFESNVASNAHFSGVMTANAVSTRYTATPANSTAVPVGFEIGTMWSDGSYVYVVTGASTIKRASLATW